MIDQIENQQLENRIFKIILLFGIILSIANMLINLTVGFDYYINFKWIFYILLSFVILFLAEKKGYHLFYLRLIYFVFLIFIFIPLAWLQSGGSDNNAISYLFVILIGFSLLFKNVRIRNFLTFSLISIFLIIYFLEYKYPGLITRHSSETQFWDKLFQTPIALFSGYFLLQQFSYAYNKEKEKLKIYGQKLKTANKKLNRIANRDSLTGKFNRRAFDTEIKNIFKNKLHQHLDLSVILLDIDNFKKINDNYGHDRGDQIIIEMADQLSRAMPTNSLISRWGGDEFAVICYKSEKEAEVYLDKYFKNIEKLSSDLDMELTVSAGLTGLRKKDQVNSLFKRVDNILYQAKESGKARYTVA